jgi:hypothetical protein
VGNKRPVSKMVSCDMKHKLVGSASCDIVRDTYLCTRDSGIVHVTTTHLLATALPLLLIAVAGHHFDLGVENGLMVGVARSFVQLMILGMILQPIFVLGMDMSWVVGLCE